MLNQSNPTPRDFGGQTGKSLAGGFVTIKTAGARELAERLQKMADALDATGARGQQLLANAVKKASEPIKKSYRSKVGNVTGNLARSTKTLIRKYDGAVVAVTGPEQTGPVGATADKPSGNHAWLVEFGSGPRRPGTQGRRTYLNVHQSINGKMTRHSSANDQQFASMSRGYYFLMGSINEPTRQARMGSGYPHDFGFSDGKMHPITLHPGETYGAMPASHAMERSINESAGEVQGLLITTISQAINSLASQ